MAVIYKVLVTRVYELSTSFIPWATFRESLRPNRNYYTMSDIKIIINNNGFHVFKSDAELFSESLICKSY
jgi:hypothetical protein